mgnify:FL=1
MLNKIFKSGLIGVFSLLMTVAFTSCEKQKETIGVIIVKDFNNNTISAASVTLHQDSLQSDQGNWTSPTIRRTEQTDANGRAEFTYELEAILNIEVIKEDGNSTYTGANIIRLLKGKTVTQVVEIN